MTTRDGDAAAGTARATAALVAAATGRLMASLAGAGVGAGAEGAAEGGAAEAGDGVGAAAAGSALRGASRLPGWTRAHVATHIARNADSFTWMLDGAAVGETREQYPGGPTTRAAAIDAGAARAGAEVVADVQRAAGRLAAVCARLDPEVWSRPVRPRAGEISAAQLLWSRLREVEVHHVDLDLGYDPTGWMPEFVEVELEARVAGLAARLPRGTALRLVAADAATAWEVGDGPASVTVAGPRAVILGWLLGRGGGEGLEAPAGLPDLATW